MSFANATPSRPWPNVSKRHCQPVDCSPFRYNWNIANLSYNKPSITSSCSAEHTDWGSKGYINRDYSDIALLKGACTVFVALIQWQMDLPLPQTIRGMDIGPHDFFKIFFWYTQKQTGATWGHTSTYIQIWITEWVSRQAKEHNTNIDIRITYSVCSQKQLYYFNSFTLHTDNMPPILFILGFRW